MRTRSGTPRRRSQTPKTPSRSRRNRKRSRRRRASTGGSQVRQRAFAASRFSAGEASANEDASGDESPAVDAFVAAGFVLENDAATEVSHDRKDRTSVDARRLTLPYTADVRLVSFLAERMATAAAAASPLAAPLAAKARRLAAPGYRKARAVDPTKPPAGGRGAGVRAPGAAGPRARAQLDDEFFRRDAPRVAAEFARAKAAGRRERAHDARVERKRSPRMKEEGAEEDKKTKRTDPVTVRVRLPDGTQLLGRLGLGNRSARSHNARSCTSLCGSRFGGSTWRFSGRRYGATKTT